MTHSRQHSLARCIALGQRPRRSDRATHFESQRSISAPVAGRPAVSEGCATKNRIRAGADAAMGYPRFGMLDLLKLLIGLLVGLFRSHAAREAETAFLRASQSEDSPSRRPRQPGYDFR